jgi:steroid delta-isomerase
MPDEHPARAAALKSQSAMTRGARDEWLGLFADDAVIEDPVGKSPLDPAGDGHRGKKAITRFYDNIIGDAKVTFDFAKSYAAGNECAFAGSLTTEREGLPKTVVELVAVYRINPDGTLASLRTFWEFDKLMEQMK